MYDVSSGRVELFPAAGTSGKINFAVYLRLLGDLAKDHMRRKGSCVIFIIPSVSFINWRQRVSRLKFALLRKHLSK
jgi:hypothetical protein